MTIRRAWRNILSTAVKLYRIDMGWSQEVMAEYLNISWRAYNNLENARNDFSGYTLISFLLLLPEQSVIDLLHQLKINFEQDDIYE